MSVFQPGNVAYGLSQALIGVPNEPIVAQRAPTTADKATIGTIWIDQPTNTPYILTSIVDNVATWVFASGGSSILSIVTDAGTAFPVAGVINLLGGANIVTSAAGNTINVAVTPNINLPATNAAGTQGIYEIGGSRFAYAYPPSNTFVGINAGNTTLNSVSAVDNTGIGNLSLTSLTLGTFNTAVGQESLESVTTGNSNTAVGERAAPNITTGSSNTVLGELALDNLVTGNNNIVIGELSAAAYTTSESSNIIINNSGVIGESNVIRIGTQGSGLGQQDACAIAGIYNTGIGATHQVMLIDNTGFMGSSKGTDGQVLIGSTAGSPAWADLTAGANITITNAANSITIASSGGGGGITTLDGDAGSATGATVTIAGGSNINTSAAGATLTVNLDNNVTISGNFTSTAGNFELPAPNAGLTQGAIEVGGEVFMQFYGDSGVGDYNIGIGKASGGPGTVNPGGGGTGNIAIGTSALHAVTTGGGNTAIGNSTGTAITSGANNFLVGLEAGFSITSGSQNCLFGSQPGLFFTTGSFNLILGASQAGVNYAGGESDNILIGNPGVVSENNVIRIGNQGTGNAQQDACWIAGIYGVTPGGGGIQMVVMDNTGQLGTTAGGGGGVTTIDGDSGSATGATITFNATPNSGSSIRFAAAGSTVDFDVTDSNGNTLMGFDSGVAGISGTANTGFGENTLHHLTTGLNNAAFGQSALLSCTIGQSNAAMGQGALASLTSGEDNTAAGAVCLNFITTGDNNIGLGFDTGTNYTSSESSNIVIGNAGTLGESNVIRIGTQGSGTGQQNACFVAGIAGATVASSAAVLINTGTGQLGTVISSRRYKENINDMDSASNNIMNLRPVTFFMKNDPTKHRQYGLIAEEVNEILPDLVIYNKVGDPESVKYHDLPVLLLNELQKQNNIIAELQRKIEVLENRRRYESKA